MNKIALRLNAYIQKHPFNSGDSDCETVLDQLYQAYAEFHESDPPEIGDGFKELEEFLCVLPLEDNNAVFNLCCRLCSSIISCAPSWSPAIKARLSCSAQRVLARQ